MWYWRRARYTSMCESSYYLYTAIYETSYYYIFVLQHSYRGGAQHTSLQQYHDAGFKTSVFFLQNRKGSEKWPVTEIKVQKLQEAFKKWD
jgi:hypothetical protein